MPQDTNLYDLVAQESARQGMPREKVLALALAAIANGRLPVRLPDDVSLDAPLTTGGSWRTLIRGAEAAVERQPAFFAGWFRSIAVDQARFRKWLKDNWPGYSKPLRGRKPTKREAVETAMRARLRNDLTVGALANMHEKELEAQFGASRTTCRNARTSVLAEAEFRRG